MNKKHEIIKELFLKKEVNAYIRKVSGYLHPELKSELFEVLCKMPEEKLIEEYKKRHFLKWVNCIVNNLWLSNKFKRAFKKNSKIITANQFNKETGDWENDWVEEFPASAADLLPYRELEKRISKLPYLTRQLLNLYIDNGSNVRKLFRKTGIPIKYISGQVKEAREHLRDTVSPSEIPTPILNRTRSFETSSDVERWERENYN